MTVEIIAFTGPRGSGKTTTSKICRDILHDIRDVYHVSFADFLREWIRDNFGDNVEAASKSRILKDIIYQDELPILVSGNNLSIHTQASPRDILIAAGTMLRTLNEDIFCIALEKKIKEIELNEYSNSPIILIDDLRFENERKWLKSIDYSSNLVFLDRIDVSSSLLNATSDIKDYIDFGKCDYIHQTYTYSDPTVSIECRNNTVLMLRSIIGMDIDYDVSVF